MVKGEGGWQTGDEYAIIHMCWHSNALPYRVHFVNGYTFRGSNSFIFVFASHLIRDQLSKE